MQKACPCTHTPLNRCRSQFRSRWGGVTTSLDDANTLKALPYGLMLLLAGRPRSAARMDKKHERETCSGEIPQVKRQKIQRSIPKEPVHGKRPLLKALVT